MLRKNWWKILSFILLFYTFTAGFLGGVPVKPILNETIRNLYFHVAMWFGMMIFFIISVSYSVKYLRYNKLTDDIYAVEFARSRNRFWFFGTCHRFSLGKIYLGCFLEQRSKTIGSGYSAANLPGILRSQKFFDGCETNLHGISAVYNVFAFAMLFPTIWIIPRLVESLHPGGMGKYPLRYKRY